MLTPAAARVALDAAFELRPDLRLIAQMIEPGARVLDVGCGDGALLAYLAAHKNVDARGIELSMEGVQLCVAKGLAVIQGDGDTDLAVYPDDAFDYVILSQTIQAVRRPDTVLRNMLRIGRHSVVSFPNQGHWHARLRLLLRGRMPTAPEAPYAWYDTPNIHPCTLQDFEGLCAQFNVVIEKRVCLDYYGAVQRLASHPWLSNIISRQALFVLHERH